MFDFAGAETVPAGTIDVGSYIRLRSGRTLRGQGPRSILKAAAELTTGVLVGLGADAAEDVTISDLVIDLSNLSGGSVKAIQMTNASRVRLVRVKIIAAPELACLFTTGHDVRLVDCDIESTSGGVRFNVESTDCGVHGSTIRDASGKCILVASASLRCRAVGNDLAITGLSGQECIGFEDDCHDAYVAGNYCVGAPDDNCIGVGGHRSKVIGNTVNGAGKHGISIGDGTTDPYDAIVQGNVIQDAGSVGGAAWAGIVLQGAIGATVTGNRVTGCNEYGIKGTTEDYCVVANNDLRGNVTGPTSLTGANNVVANNVTSA